MLIFQGSEKYRVQFKYVSIFISCIIKQYDLKALLVASLCSYCTLGYNTYCLLASAQREPSVYCSQSRFAIYMIFPINQYVVTILLM
jgi:hypothetical protein